MSTGCSLLIGCALLERELRLLIASAGTEPVPPNAAGSTSLEQPAGRLARQPARIELVLLEQGLHERPEQLRQRLQAEIDRADGRYDRIILAYGLCSNGLNGLKAGRTPLLVPRAHDCITLLLGSRQRYRTYFDQFSGTYWYSVGWLETGHPPGPDHLERKRSEFLEQYEDEEAVDFLIEEEQRWIRNYSRACFIRQGLEDDSAHVARTQAAADRFGWCFDTLEGDLGLLRDLVAGREDPERLLMVPPGFCVTPSFDEQIVVATACGAAAEPCVTDGAAETCACAAAAALCASGKIPEPVPADA